MYVCYSTYLCTCCITLTWFDKLIKSEVDNKIRWFAWGAVSLRCLVSAPCLQVAAGTSRSEARCPAGCSAWLPAVKSILRYGRVRLENTQYNSAFTYPARLILKIKELTSIYGKQPKKKSSIANWENSTGLTAFWAKHILKLIIIGGMLMESICATA